MLAHGKSTSLPLSNKCNDDYAPIGSLDSICAQNAPC